uniref:(northern house mosquito) hypothetical protein n=1 Tax=Culex pipiens TaxID=7175 RepID=A0A8D8IM38_CULPI
MISKVADWFLAEPIDAIRKHSKFCVIFVTFFLQKALHYQLDVLLGEATRGKIHSAAKRHSTRTDNRTNDRGGQKRALSTEAAGQLISQCVLLQPFCVSTTERV